MLAEGYEVGDGCKKYTITLRSNVCFHNGRMMTSHDVVASLQRWVKLAVVAVPFFRDDIKSIGARGAPTVVIRLKQPSGILIEALTPPIQFAGIYPASVADAAGTRRITDLSDLIGTDVQTRINGVITGQYDYAESITPDAYRDLCVSPKVRTLILKPYGQPMAVFNKRRGLFTARRLLAEAGYRGQPVIISPTWPGWWTTEEKDRLIGRLICEPDPQARKRIGEDVQRLYWENVPIIKFGDFFNLAIARPGVQGLATRPDLFFWNVCAAP